MIPRDRLRPPPGRRIGLLGGSFNPAHEGHLHITRIALRRLALDEAWWMVSPQNPLKPAAGMAGLAARLASAEIAAQDPRIRVTAIEATLGTRFTADTLGVLAARFPAVRFVWLMGADNLTGIVRWQRWRDIFRTMPVCVIARPGHGLRALTSRAATVFADARIPERDAASLPLRTPPAWTYLSEGRDPASATAIRAAGGWPV